jgi:hypothetical protein
LGVLDWGFDCTPSGTGLLTTPFVFGAGLLAPAAFPIALIMACETVPGAVELCLAELWFGKVGVVSTV